MAPKTKTKAKAKQPNYLVPLRLARLVAEMPNHPLGWSLSGISEYLRVHERTVRRYIKALAEEFSGEDGRPLFVIEKKGEKLRLVKRREHVDGMSGSVYHLISMHLSLEFFRMLGKNVVALSVEDVLDRVKTNLSPRERELIQDLDRKFYNAPYAPKDYSGHEDILEDVIKALVYQNVIKIQYRRGGSDEARTYTLEPYSLLYHKGGFYLAARSPKYKRPTFYSIERIRKIELLPEKFAYPADYHPDQLLDGAFGIWSGTAQKFVLKFPSDLADYIASRRWHKSQRIKRQKDGSIILTLHVADTEEVRAWIRSFGRGVKVLKGRVG